MKLPAPVVFTVAAVVFVLGACQVRAQDPQVPDIDLFLRTVQSDDARADAALAAIAPAWQDGYTPILVDLASFASARVQARLFAFLEERTGQRFDSDINRWRQWMWDLPYDPHPDYAAFKGMLFGQIDPRMAAFFTGDPRAEIRLDEIQWGGVAVNGIPPLDHPVMIAAADADYLDEDDIVFGVVLNGDARAFPKRILGWHEMAMDVIGGVEVTVIYCTLCGTILPYESEIGGQVRRFGTSGLLYRSNKLFFDRDTLSLWSTLQGRPVVGPLVGEEGLDLVLRSSVTTTWGEWVRRHPDSRVLSLDTGYARDYSEGTAYREYFSNDALMFDVPERDDRLENKAEVLVMQVEDGSGNRVPWAISARFLDENPVYPFSASGTSLLVVTTAGGANRVYEVGDVQFEPSRDPGSVTDRSGQSWQVTEEALIGPDRTRLPRRTANRAFWFGWYAQFPETELIY